MIRSTTANLFMVLGSATSRRFRISKEQSGRQLQRKENLFHVKTNLKQTENIIQWTKHAKENFKCEYHKSINKGLFGVGAVMI